MRSVFRFADATAIITQQTTWEERDQAIKHGEEKLNNSNFVLETAKWFLQTKPIA